MEVAVTERPQRFRLFRRRGESRTLTRENVPPVPGVLLTPTASGVTVTDQAALRVADVFACIRLLAHVASTLPLVVYRREGEERKRAEGQLADLLRKPAPATTTANFVAQMVGHLVSRGEVFVGKFVNAEGEIAQLGAISPGQVPLVEIKSGEPEYTLAHRDGAQTVHGTDDLIHIRGLSLDGVRGMGTLRACAEALGLASVLQTHTSAVFANHSVPRGIFVVPSGPTAPDLMENLRVAVSDRHGSPERAGTVGVFQGDIDFKAISLSASDSELVEQLRLSTQTCARIFGIPPWMIGAASADPQTYSNVESQSLAFLVYSLAPWLTVIEQALSADEDLCPPGSNLFCEFLTDGILRADSKTRAEVYTAALDPITGWMRRDEVRRLENLEAESSERELVGVAA